MTKSELVKMYYKLDQEKFKLLEKGVSFQLIIEEDGNFLQTGIGTGATMSLINVYGIISLYKTATNGVTIEEFAESVKDATIQLNNQGWPSIEKNE